ncbi:MAG TPA: DUF3108 domain-containing protein [Acidiferrobacterales bacterium]|nr:DUF3108 domain-containing protein [Acidiferrobacterales bacterium]
MTVRAFAAVTFLLLTATALVPAQAAEPPALPASLELNYVLRYSDMTVGRVVKTLTREADGSYRHRSHSTPLGMAKMFTGVEWLEEGQFEVVQGKVRPLSFLEYRTGADKPHRHSARFDWKAQKIFYENWPTTPLPPGTQDQGSILFALMLNPPTPGTKQTIHISSGKKLRVYRYAHAGTETLKTTLGAIKTTVIERPPLDKDGESFRVWLAAERGNLPVRISTQKRGQETILELESVSGL